MIFAASFNTTFKILLAYRSTLKKLSSSVLTLYTLSTPYNLRVEVSSKLKVTATKES